jgi:hypothetical protein
MDEHLLLESLARITDDLDHVHGQLVQLAADLPADHPDRRAVRHAAAVQREVLDEIKATSARRVHAAFEAACRMLAKRPSAKRGRAE